MCGDNRSFCHVKAKGNEERICVPQHSFSLCIAARSFCSHRQTPNALGEPGTPVPEHLGQSAVCSQRHSCNISPQKEMDLDFGTFSMLRKCSALTFGQCLVLGLRGERHSPSLALQSFLKLDTSWASSAFTTRPNKQQGCSSRRDPGMLLALPQQGHVALVAQKAFAVTSSKRLKVRHSLLRASRKLVWG